MGPSTTLLDTGERVPWCTRVRGCAAYYGPPGLNYGLSMSPPGLVRPADCARGCPHEKRGSAQLC